MANFFPKNGGQLSDSSDEDWRDARKVVHRRLENLKITEVTTTVETIRSTPENTRVNVDEQIIDYDPYDQNLVDADDLQVGDYEGLGSMRNPELEEVVEYITDPNDQLKENATAFLQHLCYQDEQVKERSRALGVIVPLVALLRHENPIIQRNAAGVLRNLCYGPNSEQSKLEVFEANGINALVCLIRLSPFDDIRDIATATLWNMSSSEKLKDVILDQSLQTLVNAIIVPFSGWSPDVTERRNPQGVFPSFFKNATGILRNCSSAGIEARQKLRCADNLIPSLLHAVQSALMCHVENKSLENCLCLLRNLCYRLQEVRNLPSKESGVPNSQFGPSQLRLLWQPELIPCYITFLRQSTNPNVLEAAAGCIQNLTAWAAHLRVEVRKANGLPVLIELLRAAEFDPLVRVCAIALRNLAVDNKNKEIICEQGMQDLIKILPPYISPTETVVRVASNSTLTAVLAAINAIIFENENGARTCALAGGIERMVGIVTNHRFYCSKVIRYTAHVLRVLWKFSSLHHFYKQIGFSEFDFKVDYCLTTDFKLNSDRDHSLTSNCTLLRPRADLASCQPQQSTIKQISRKHFTRKPVDCQSVLYATVNKPGHKKEDEDSGLDRSSSNQLSITEADSWV